jgi:hypothetical protein
MTSTNILTAPCGMNCGICMAYLRQRNKCPGCRIFNAKKPVSIAQCKIKNCSVLKKNNFEFCFQCESFPCDRLKHLDKRYRIKYNMSMIENLQFIQKKGIEKFLKNEKKRWSCAECGGTICVHKARCSACGTLLQS